MGKTNESIIRLNDQFAELNEALNENGGEITPEIEEQMNALELSQEEVAENIRQLVAWNKKQDEYIDEEIKRLQARKKARKNTVDYFKRRLLETMMANGINKIKTAFCTVTLCEGRESVGCDESFVTSRYEENADRLREILPDYIKVTLTVDKTEALRMLKQGAPVPTHNEGNVELPDIYITKSPYLLVK